MSTTERIAAIVKPINVELDHLNSMDRHLTDGEKARVVNLRQARAHVVTLEAEVSAEPVDPDAHIKDPEAYLAAKQERAKGTDFDGIEALRLAPTDLAGVVEAGDNLDHKFIDLVAFCAANIPESKLQDLVDDWAGHEERAAWTNATKHLRPNT